jgi:hypothetical protein
MPGARSWPDHTHQISDCELALVSVGFFFRKSKMSACAKVTESASAKEIEP